MSAVQGRVVRALIADIAASRVRPGERLPSAADLERQFGVTSEVARAALSELEQRGMARLEPEGRSIVRDESHWDVLDPEVLEVLLASPHGPAILAEYLEYRRMIEVIAAGLAAEQATTEDLATLSGALATMTAAAEEGSPDAEARFHDADVAFHHALVAAGQNRPLELAAAPLRTVLCTARRPLARPDLRQERGLPEHARILAAVAQGDPEAARDAMESHLDTVERYLREYAGVSQTSAPPDDC
jgi:DNA-binding FadR family transcriptional regulator